MIDLNKFDATDKSKILHTSAHAQAALGQQIGAGGGQTFRQRREIEGGRRHVRSYRDSQMGRQFSAVRPRTAQEVNAQRQRFAASSDAGSGTIARASDRAAQSTQQSPVNRSFQGRGYDPYS